MATTPPPVPSPPPAQRSWWQRNWKWVLPVGCLLPVLVCGGCLIGIFFTATTAIRSTAAYQDALQQIQNDPQVIEQLGQPIEAGWMMQGNVKVENDAGNADATFPVSGPKGNGTATMRAVRESGQWWILYLTVDVEGGERIVLVDEEQAGAMEEQTEESEI